MPNQKFSYEEPIELSGDEAQLLVDVSYHLGSNVYITKGATGFHTFRLVSDPDELDN